MKACQQFEDSAQSGQVLFHPQVAAGQPAPNCVALFDEVGRFGVTILEGRYTVEDGQWFRHQADGARSAMDHPLERAWQAATSVRTELNRGLDINTYVIAVAWFPDMGRGRGHPGRGRWPQSAVVLRSGRPGPAAGGSPQGG